MGVIACDGNSGKELIETATNDNFEEDKLLVEQETDVNANDKDGVTDLMQASGNGNLETVKDLVKRKRVNINAKDKYGITALMYTSINGNLEIVKYLLENDADINAKDNDWGYTALIYAAEYVNLETVQFLIESGADINIKNNDGKTALDLAETEEIKEVLRKAGIK